MNIDQYAGFLDDYLDFADVPLYLEGIQHDLRGRHVIRCRICGCTDREACIDPESGMTCQWAAPELCSACCAPEAK